MSPGGYDWLKALPPRGDEAVQVAATRLRCTRALAARRITDARVRGLLVVCGSGRDAMVALTDRGIDAAWGWP